MPKSKVRSVSGGGGGRGRRGGRGGRGGRKVSTGVSEGLGSAAVTENAGSGAVADGGGSGVAPALRAPARTTRSVTQLETRRVSARRASASRPRMEAEEGAAEALVGLKDVRPAAVAAAAAASTPPPAVREGRTRDPSSGMESTGKRSAGGRLADSGSYAAMLHPLMESPLRGPGATGVGAMDIEHEPLDVDSAAFGSSSQRGTSTAAAKRPAGKDVNGRTSKAKKATGKGKGKARLDAAGRAAQTGGGSSKAAGIRKGKGKATHEKKDGKSRRNNKAKERDEDSDSDGGVIPLRAYTQEEKEAAVVVAIENSPEFHSTKFSFNNDFGKNMWLERIGGGIVRILQKNKGYMKIHKGAVGPLFETKVGMKKLKKWFYNQKSLVARERHQAPKTGASGGKIEGPFVRLRRQLYEGNVAVSKVAMSDGRGSIGQGTFDGGDDEQTMVGLDFGTEGGGEGEEGGGVGVEEEGEEQQEEEEEEEEEEEQKEEEWDENGDQEENNEEQDTRSGRPPPRPSMTGGGGSSSSGTRRAGTAAKSSSGRNVDWAAEDDYLAEETNGLARKPRSGNKRKGGWKPPGSGSFENVISQHVERQSGIEAKKLGLMEKIAQKRTGGAGSSESNALELRKVEVAEKQMILAAEQHKEASRANANKELAAAGAMGFLTAAEMKAVYMANLSESSKEALRQVAGNNGGDANPSESS